MNRGVLAAFAAFVACAPASATLYRFQYEQVFEGNVRASYELISPSAQTDVYAFFEMEEEGSQILSCQIEGNLCVHVHTTGTNGGVNMQGFTEASVGLFSPFLVNGQVLTGSYNDQLRGATLTISEYQPLQQYPAALRARPGASAVPEPATWAMMLTGFGLLGWRSRNVVLRLQTV